MEVDDGASDTTGGAPRPGSRDENGAGVSWFNNDPCLKKLFQGIN